jgi:uncharacterized membrane protein
MLVVFYQENLVLFLGIIPSVIASLPSQYSVSFILFMLVVYYFEIAYKVDN